MHTNEIQMKCIRVQLVCPRHAHIYVKHFRLQSSRGLPALTKTFEDVKFKGKGYEVSVITVLYYSTCISPCGHLDMEELDVCLLTFDYSS